MFELRGKYSGYDPLQTDEESLFPSPKQKPYVSRNALAASSLILAVVGSVILLKDTKIPAWIGGSSAFDAKTAPKQMSKEINFSFKKSGYDPLPYFDTNYDRLTTYPFLNNYVSVIEPYSSMLFHMYEKSEYDVHYSVCNDSGSCQKGIWNAKDETSDAVKFECSPYDKLTVTAKMYDANDQVLHSVSGSALCLYVRREVRSLSEDELTRFIGVSAMLNQIKDKDGLEKYGPNYMSSSTLVKYHHFNAVQQNADHIHEGNGFVIQHVKLTNLFENSLQSVDPSLTLPYWDFTIDSKSGLTMDKASIFTEKMYGSNYEATTVTDGWTYKNDLILNGRIKDGPWKDLKVEMNPYEGDEYNFGFGYMRAPWNLNPSPYLSRYPLIETTAKIGEFYMPTCTDHYEALKYDDRMDFYLESSFDPHGTLHILEGGFYGCDLLQPLVDAGYITDYNSVCYYWVFTLKELYRAGDISPNKDCMIKENMQDTFCGYSCPNDGAGVYSKVKSMVGIGLDTTKEGIEDAFKDFVCGGDGGRIFPGDHLESASPADPSFWVIHPTLERLLHAKLLAGGFMTSNEWPTNSKKDYVCAKTSCYGHYQDDQMYDGLAGSTTSFFGPTNREVESATDARAADYSMPYIYDNFEWDHCDEDFDGLLVNLFNDMQEYITEEETAAAGGNTRRRASTRRVPRPEAQVKVRAEKAKVVEENMKKM